MDQLHVHTNFPSTLHNGDRLVPPRISQEMRHWDVGSSWQMANSSRFPWIDTWVFFEVLPCIGQYVAKRGRKSVRNGPLSGNLLCETLFRAKNYASRCATLHV